MAADWYCRIAGAELGPLSSQQLKALGADGRLRADDEVCQGKGGKWVQASRVKGLLKSAGSEVLVARSLDEEDESSTKKPESEKRRAKPASESKLRKAKSVPKPPEPAKTAVPVAKVAVVGGASGSAAPAPSPFNFEEPGADRDKSAGTRPPPLSSSDIAKRRQGQRKKLLIGSLGVLGGGIVVVVILFVTNPFGGAPNEEPARHASVEDVDVDLDGEITTGIDDLLPGTQRRSDAPPAVDAADGERWLDASKDTATLGPVSVRVVGARIDRPALTRARGTAARPPEDYLIITLELANTDPAKKVVHSGWSGGAAAANGVSLVDNHRNQYKARTFTGATIDGQLRDTSLYADEPVREVLVFERPVEAAKYLRLTLPAAAVEHSGMLRFQIPRDMIGAEPSEEVADAPRRPRPDRASDDDDDVHRLDVVEKAVQRAAGLEPVEPERELTGFEKMKRDNPELFPEQ